VSWTAVRVEAAAPELHLEALLATLFAHGAGGVQEEGSVLTTCFPDTADIAAIVRALADVDATARVDVGPLPDVDWTTRWREGIRARVVGRLTVGPPWLVNGADPDAIAIEPEMAFGTGEHASTRGVLRLLQEVVRPDDLVADLGAGSAVLSIAAAKLGARGVAAVEQDPDAIANAEGNVACNGVGDRVRVILGDAANLLPLLAPVQVIAANILAPVLLELADAMAAALSPGGHAIVGGVLLGERAVVLHGFENGGWVVEREDVEPGMDDQPEAAWWSATLVRP
jgi:ribosomal protein L11 methyltransferase